MLPIEHCPSVFYIYFCTREEKIEHYGDFWLHTQKGTGTLRMGDSDELVLADCFMQLVEQSDGRIRRVDEFATNM